MPDSLADVRAYLKEGLAPEQLEAMKAAPPDKIYRFAARRLASYYGLDPDKFEAQVDIESAFNPQAKSNKGAEGIAQFIPETAKRYGVNVKDPLSSLDGMARHMRDLSQEFGGDWEKAATAYHSGSRNVKNGTLGPNGKAYAPSILKKHDELIASRTPAPSPEPTPGVAIASMGQQEPAAAPPAEPVEPTDNRLAQAGSSVAEAGASTADFLSSLEPMAASQRLLAAAQDVANGVPVTEAIGAHLFNRGASEAVAPYMAPPPVTATGTALREGVGPVVIGALTGGVPGAISGGLSAAGGYFGEQYGDVVGLSPGQGRFVGGLVGGALPDVARGVAHLPGAVREVADQVDEGVAAAIKPVDDFLTTDVAPNLDPQARATVIRQVLQGQDDAIRELHNARYTQLLQGAEQQGASVPWQAVGLDEKQIAHWTTTPGLPSTVGQRAKAALKTATERPLTVTEAHFLQSDLGKIARKIKASDPVAFQQVRALQTDVRDTLVASLGAVGPKTAQAYLDLTAATRRDFQVFNRKVVRTMLATADERSAQTAQSVLNGVLGKQQADNLDALLKAIYYRNAGIESVAAHREMGAALVSRFVQQATNENGLNYAKLRTILRRPENELALRKLVPSDGRAFLLRSLDSVVKAQAAAAKASGPTVFESLLNPGRIGTAVAIASGVSQGTGTGALVGGITYGGVKLLRWLVNGENRTLLARAMRTPVLSRDGQELARALSVALATAAQPKPVPGLPPPATDAAPSAPASPRAIAP